MKQVNFLFFIYPLTVLYFGRIPVLNCLIALLQAISEPGSSKMVERVNRGKQPSNGRPEQFEDRSTLTSYARPKRLRV